MPFGKCELLGTPYAIQKEGPDPFNKGGQRVNTVFLSIIFLIAASVPGPFSLLSVDSRCPHHVLMPWQDASSKLNGAPIPVKSEPLRKKERKNPFDERQDELLGSKTR